MFAEVQQLLSELFKWWVVVTPWEQAVRVRAGKRTHILGPGIHARLPLIDVVYKQPIRLRAQHINGQTVSTKDGKTISVSSAIRFEIEDIELVYQRMHNASELLEQEVQSVLAQVITQNRLEEISPTYIENEVFSRLSFKCYGLKLHGFFVTGFAVVKTYRLINGEMGTYSDWSDRFDIMSESGERPR